MSFVSSIDRADPIFGAIYEALDKVENSNTFKASHSAIKKGVVNANNISKKGCFGLKFTKEISLESYDRFLKALKIKARDATGIVPSIDSCVLQETQPMGFRRMIRIGAHQGIQRVWEEQNEKSFKIIFKTVGVKFIATNEIRKKKDGKVVFIARYLIDDHPNPKYHKADWFLENVMNPTFKNLIELVSSRNLNERYQKIVLAQGMPFTGIKKTILRPVVIVVAIIVAIYLAIRFSE